MTERPERAIARVSTHAIEANCRRLAGALSPGASLCVVVKADGYGHGAVQVAEAARRGGADWLAVVSSQEAEDLRLAGVSGPILVMGPLTADEVEQALVARADVAAWDAEFLDALIDHARHHGTVARVHVKLDSGMGRLGTFDPALASSLVRRAAADESLEAVGLWTHFATADEPESGHFADQLACFRPLAEELKAEHAELVVHAANSAATLRDPTSHFDMVRCGIAVYGLDPFHSDPLGHDLEPALTLSSYVAQVKRFPAGASAGYGRRWIAERDTDVALVPIGYGDGFRRALTNNAEVLIGGRRRPLVGTVSMDSVTIDLGPDSGVRWGEEVVLIGPQGEERILCEEVARRVGTINYEITCGLTPRTRRVYPS